MWRSRGPAGAGLLRITDTEIHFASDKNHQIVKRGTPDSAWIPTAGENGWLVFSQNKHMLGNAAERMLLMQHNVGIVFLENGNANSHLVMKLILNRWEWMRLIDSNEARPFAYMLRLAGGVRRLHLHSTLPLGTPPRESSKR